MTPTPIATPARQIKGILEAKYRNPKRTIPTIEALMRPLINCNINTRNNRKPITLL